MRAAWHDRIDLSVVDIAAQHGLTSQKIRYRAMRDKWGPRPSEARGVGHKRRGNVTRQELVQRIYNVLAQELTIVEQRMQAILAAPDASGEKEASGVAAVIGNLQKLKAEANAKRSRRSAEGQKQLSAPDLNAARRELAHRVARLRKQWEHGLGRKPADE